MNVVAVSGSLCPYCENATAAGSFTDEHVWPQVFGGELAGADFVIRICKRCNDLCGLFVDAEFEKSFFVSNRRGVAALAYLDLENGYPLPLAYFGVVQDIDPAPYGTAEFWIAPCRSRILHLHDSAGEKFTGYAGGNPIARKKKPGTAIFINAAENEKQARVDLRSFAQKFDKERRLVWGVSLSPDIAVSFEQKFGSEPTGADDLFVQKFIELERQPLRLGLSIRLDFEHRFMAKVALGLGYKLLGDDFLKSSWSRRLRETLWAQGQAQGQLAPVGRGEIGRPKEDTLGDVLEWQGGVLLAVFPSQRNLVVAFNVFGARHEVVISDDPAFWGQVPDLMLGRVWVLIPQRKFCAGPISLNEFFRHKAGGSESPKLMEAESWRKEGRRSPDE